MVVSFEGAAVDPDRQPIRSLVFGPAGNSAQRRGTSTPAYPMSASVAQTNRSRHLRDEVDADHSAHHQEPTRFCNGLFLRVARRGSWRAGPGQNSVDSDQGGFSGRATVGGDEQSVSRPTSDGLDAQLPHNQRCHPS
jgi:hypothetical protein